MQQSLRRICILMNFFLATSAAADPLSAFCDDLETTPDEVLLACSKLCFVKIMH